MTEIQADPRRCPKCAGLMKADIQSLSGEFTLYKCSGCSKEIIVERSGLEVRL